MRAFVAGAYDSAGHPVTAVEYPRILQDLFGAEQARSILAEYPLVDYPTPSLALATLLTDSGDMLGACTQLPAADAAAKRAPVFAYEFAEPDAAKIGDFPSGAYHGVDIPYFFDSSSPGPWTPPTPTGTRKALADKLIGYWTQFARTANPGPDWPKYRYGTAISFTADRIGPVDVAREPHCEFWNQQFERRA
jgi:para-nitrobenzyl esterase